MFQLSGFYCIVSKASKASSDVGDHPGIQAYIQPFCSRVAGEERHCQFIGTTELQTSLPT